MPSTKQFRGKSLADQIIKYMDKMEAQFQRAFITLIESVTGSPELREVIDMITTGRAVEVTPELLQAIDKVSVDTTVLRNISRQALSGGGRITASAVGFEGRFDLTNPRAITYARTLSSDLVTNVTRDVRENLRDIIGDAVAGDASPTETIRRIKAEVGLTKRDAAAVRNFRAGLRAAGKTVQQANTEADKYAQRLLKERARTIARTEVARSVNQGQQAFWQQAQDDGLVPPTTLRVWITAGDDACSICAPLDGQTAPIDGAWNTAAGPLTIAHAHPNCRCSSGLVFPNKVKKIDPMGYEVWLLEKGDRPGHPFRGNQWTKGKKRYYHGSATPLNVGDELKPPSETGVEIHSHPDFGDEFDNSNYVYLTDDEGQAQAYAHDAVQLGRGSERYVYEVEADSVEDDPESEYTGVKGAYRAPRARIVRVIGPVGKTDTGLKRWFKEEWVDLSRPKKGGGFEPCGRPDASEGKYPKCVPASRAARMTPEQIESAIRRKRRAESTKRREGKKPIMVPTISKASIPADMALYNKVKEEAKRKFDVYPSAYANGWLVQEYKRRGGKYKTAISKGDYLGHPFRGNQWTGGIGGGKGGTRSYGMLAETANPRHAKGFKGSERHKAKYALMAEDGSYYDYIDFDSDEHPVQQVLDLVAGETGIDISIQVNDFDEIDVELLCEAVDALQAMVDAFDPLRPPNVMFGRMGSRTGGEYSPGNDSITLNVLSIKKGRASEEFLDTYYHSLETGWHAKKEISPTQGTVVHEFGHFIHFTMSGRSAAVREADFMFETTAPTPSERLARRRATDELLFATAKIEKQIGALFGIESTSWTRFKDTTKAQKTKITEGLSEYGSKNLVELWAEAFASAYCAGGDRSAIGSQAGKILFDALESNWGEITAALAKLGVP